MLSFARALQLSATRLASWERVYRLRAYWETCEGGLMLIVRKDGHELFTLVPWEALVRMPETTRTLLDAEDDMTGKLARVGLIPAKESKT